MLKMAFAVSLSLFSSYLWAVEVATIVACKPEGETWLCAAYENDQIQVFRSDVYLSKVEFNGEFGNIEESVAPATAPMTSSRGFFDVKLTDELPDGEFTVQLLACQALQCEKRIQQLQGIPGSQVVEVKNDNHLMHLLLVGGYPTKKAAQRAAGDIMTRYQIKDKPWVRTLESVRSRMLTP